MKHIIAILGLCLILGSTVSASAGPPKTDIIPTSAGDLTINAVGHGTLYLTLGKKVIHIDPWSKLGDYSALPKADLILLTHHHRDHLDPAAVKAVSKPGTELYVSAECAARLGSGKVLKNGDKVEVMGIGIEVLPAYNMVHKRKDGQFFHPKGVGNGYVLTLGGKRIYIAGDTENIPEMKALKGIEAAFLPMNLPYTMTPEMVADAARGFMPKRLYPYHYGQTDVGQLVSLLKDTPEIKVIHLSFGR